MYNSLRFLLLAYVVAVRSEAFDYVIAGAGTAGLVIANRLSSHPIAGDAPSAKVSRRFSASMAIVLTFSVFTCSMGIVAMDGKPNEWASQATEPRHIVAVSMAATVSYVFFSLSLFALLVNNSVA